MSEEGFWLIVFIVTLDSVFGGYGFNAIPRLTR